MGGDVVPDDVAFAQRISETTAFFKDLHAHNWTVPMGETRMRAPEILKNCDIAMEALKRGKPITLMDDLPTTPDKGEKIVFDEDQINAIRKRFTVK